MRGLRNIADLLVIVAAAVALNAMPVAAGAQTPAPSQAAVAHPELVGALAKAGAGGLASMANAFTKLGLKPEPVSKAIPVLTSFVTKSGGAGVGSLLAGVLK